MSEEKYLSVKELVERFGMSAKTIHRLLATPGTEISRLSKRGKKWAKASEVEKALKQIRQQAEMDPDVKAVLVDLFSARKTA
jgi:DeoR/GlpR family transcriptional regulator of sugar metabolism